MANTSEIQARFTEFYKELHPALSKYLQTLVYDKQEVKDLLSEVFLVAYQRFDFSLSKPDFTRFLFGIARNKYLSYCKGLSKKSFRLEPMENSPGFAQDPEVEHRMKLYDLNNYLQRLNEDERAAIVLFEVNGFAYEEIAAICEAKLSTIKSRIFEARKKLHTLADIKDDCNSPKQERELGHGK